MTEVLIESADTAVPIKVIDEGALAALLEGAGDFVKGLAEQGGFKGKAGQVLVVPGESGAVAQVLVGSAAGSAAEAMALRALPARLPAGTYAFELLPAGLDPARAMLAWALGAYRFDRYKKKTDETPRLAVPAGVDLSAVKAMSHACALARDMVNTPANDMGPLQIETIAREIAHQHGAQIEVTVGEDLLGANYPAVHAVGRAADPRRAPRMIEISWGGMAAPRVAIVGKGVVFDTGGLDLKPSSSMRLMKKDMGGAAHALALGRMVMAAGLKVRLSVLVPVVENAVSGDAMRPGDVLASRKGLTIEVGNTDAEGRLILADALARAAELEPALTIDFATLTGAARVALGPQVVPFYTDDEALAGELAAAGASEEDPVWRMPLWRGYEDALDSDVADIANDPAGWAQAGSVTAGLFLKRFAPTSPWAHFDVFAWNPKSRPGFPVGAEVQAVRAVFKVLCSRYA
ncbi:MAG TPA: leucyl aminopeptidase family protein [Caulobacteraceae bacterium]|nr:leucyl aminopeptidase family protein [Caulobacteraceae bacterium]